MDPNEAKGRIKDYKNFGKDPEVSTSFSFHVHFCFFFLN